MALQIAEISLFDFIEYFKQSFRFVTKLFCDLSRRHMYLFIFNEILLCSKNINFCNLSICDKLEMLLIIEITLSILEKLKPALYERNIFSAMLILLNIL